MECSSCQQMYLAQEEKASPFHMQIPNIFNIDMDMMTEINQIPTLIQVG